MNYLDRLKAKNSENKHLGYCKNCNKPLNDPFCSFCSSQSVGFQKNNQSLTETEVQQITDWVRSLGGSDAEIAEETTAVIEQCTDPENKSFIINCARKIKIPTQPPDPPQVKCYDCQHWRSFYSHNKASGQCAARVIPSAIVHWFDSPKFCTKFRCASDTTSP